VTYRKKSSGHFHRPKKSQLITGIPFVLSALQSGEALECIYLQNDLHVNETILLRQKADLSGVPVKKVPPEKLKSFNVDNYWGCIALRSKIQYHNLQDVISLIVDKGEAPLFLLLDGITDIRNIGAIARTAYGCGVHAIVIPEKGVGALNEDAIHTSAGALEHINICRVKSLVGAIDELHLNGFKVFASEMTAATAIFNIDFREPCAIIMGSEDKGIQPHLYKVCDEKFKIPMFNHFESLNVAVAAGIILYEVMRQRK
jgi:23S rRNA (guanosine2251-2'-O)-methyltransferase